MLLVLPAPNGYHITIKCFCSALPTQKMVAWCFISLDLTWTGAFSLCALIFVHVCMYTSYDGTVQWYHKQQQYFNKIIALERDIFHHEKAVLAESKVPTFEIPSENSHDSSRINQCPTRYQQKIYPNPSVD